MSLLCCRLIVVAALTQSEDTQADDDLFAGGHAGDQPVQNAVVADKRHHGFGKLGVTGHVQRGAAVENREGLTADRQRSEVRGQR